MVIAETEYLHLTGHGPNFIDYLMTGPSFEDLQLDRDPTPARDVDL